MTLPTHAENSTRPAAWWSSSLFVLGGLMAAGFLLRLAATSNDLWLDEVWSLWMISNEVRTPLDLVRGEMRHDNNHLLNSAWLYLLGPHQRPTIYRLPSVLAGTAGIGMAWLLGRLRGVGSARACGLAFALNYVLVDTGSDARGYGVLSLCVLASQTALLAGFRRALGAGADQDTTSPRSGLRVGRPSMWSGVFMLAATVGFLTHLTFVFCYGAALGWSIWLVGTTKDIPLRNRIAVFARWHTLPSVTVLAIYFGFVRGMTFGLGPKNTLPAAIIETCSAIVGGPFEAPWSGTIAGFMAVLGCLSLYRCWVSDRAAAILFGLTIGLVPAAVLALFPIDFYSVRYLLVPAQTLLLLVAREGGAFAKRGAWQTVAVATLAIAFCGANMARNLTLVARGRVPYSAALAYMAASSRDPGTPATCYSNHDFRFGLLFSYHEKDQPIPRVTLYEKNNLPPEGAEWYILHDSRHGGVAADRIADRQGNEYDLDRIFRSGGISPGHWYVYRQDRRLHRGAADPAAGQGAAEAGSTARLRRSRASRF